MVELTVNLTEITEREIEQLYNKYRLATTLHLLSELFWLISKVAIFRGVSEQEIAATLKELE